MNPESEELKVEFLEIQKAYETLVDMKTRAAYSTHSSPSARPQYDAALNHETFTNRSQNILEFRTSTYLLINDSVVFNPQNVFRDTANLNMPKEKDGKKVGMFFVTYIGIFFFFLFCSR